jgi:hypothetical protein
VAIPYVARAGTGADSSTTRRRRNREFAKTTDTLIEGTKKKTAERKRHLAPTVRSSFSLPCLPKRTLTLSSTFVVVCADRELRDRVRHHCREVPQLPA